MNQPHPEEIALILRHRPPQFQRMLAAVSDGHGLTRPELERHVASSLAVALNAQTRGRTRTRTEAA